MSNDVSKPTKAYYLTDDEVKAVIGWAGMAGVGFVFGGTPDPKDPGVSALRKFEAQQASET